MDAEQAATAVLLLRCGQLHELRPQFAQLPGRQRDITAYLVEGKPRQGDFSATLLFVDEFFV